MVNYNLIKWFVSLDWQAIRTSKNSYSAQFDLMKDVRVRVYTLLSGPCTNDTMIKSTRYTEVVQKPSSTGESPRSQYLSRSVVQRNVLWKMYE